MAADLGGTNLRMAVVSSSGEILFRARSETPRSDGPDKLLDALVETSRHCIENCRSSNIAGVSLAVPATVDVQSGVLLDAPNLPELNGFGIVLATEKKLNLKVFLENDANAAAIGESWQGASQGFYNSIMITLGTGVGGGIIIDGKILRGPDGTAGEIGHINVEPNGHECGCGSKGCLEQYASATAVVRIAEEIAAAKPESQLASIEVLTSENIYELGIQGDADAIDVFTRQGFYLGLALSGLINSLNPEVIVFGGGAAAGWDLFIEELRRQIEKRTYLTPAERVKLLPSELGDDAGLLGAARFGFEKIACN